MSNDLHDEIQRRAHAIWEAAGRPDGAADAHWHQAERELVAERRDSGGIPVADEIEPAG